MTLTDIEDESIERLREYWRPWITAARSEGAPDWFIRQYIRDVLNLGLIYQEARADRTQPIETEQAHELHKRIHTRYLETEFPTTFTITTEAI